MEVRRWAEEERRGRRIVGGCRNAGKRSRRGAGRQAQGQGMRDALHAKQWVDLAPGI